MGNLFKSKKPFLIVFSIITTLSVLFTNCSKKLDSQIGLSTIETNLNFSGAENLIKFTYKPKLLSNKNNDVIEFAVAADRADFLARVEYKLNDDPWLDAGGNQILLTDLNYGQQSITVRAVSNNGSVSAEQGYSWFMDNEIPEAEISVKPAATIAETSARIEFATNETANFKVNCWLNDVIIPDCQSPLILTTLLNRTTYVFKLQITDEAGNKSNLLTSTFDVSFIEPTYTSLNQFIFSRKCIGCHNTVTLAGGVSYTTYAGVLSRVTPQFPTQSLLYQRVAALPRADGTVGPRMPLGGQALTEGELKALSDWITAGALDN